MTQYIQRRTVSRTFYTILIDTLPVLLTDPRYMRFMEYIMFTRFLDNQDGAVLIPCELVKAIGQTRMAVTFLEEFSANVMPIAWTHELEHEYDHRDHTCRRLS